MAAAGRQRASRHRAGDHARRALRRAPAAGPRARRRTALTGKRADRPCGGLQYLVGRRGAGAQRPAQRLSANAAHPEPADLERAARAARAARLHVHPRAARRRPRAATAEPVRLGPLPAPRGDRRRREGRWRDGKAYGTLERAVTKRALGRLYPFVFAGSVVVVATLLRTAADPWLGRTVPYLFFYPAIIVAATFGGFAAGVFATGLSGLVSSVLYLEPVGSLMVHGTADRLALSLFLLNGLVISR